MTNLNEHNSSMNVGWRPKRAISIEKGCKTKSSKYCETFDSKCRDYYWLCAEHAEQHKHKILDKLKKTVLLTVTKQGSDC